MLDRGRFEGGCFGRGARYASGDVFIDARRWEYVSVRHGTIGCERLAPAISSRDAGRLPWLRIDDALPGTPGSTVPPP